MLTKLLLSAIAIPALGLSMMSSPAFMDAAATKSCCSPDAECCVRGDECCETGVCCETDAACCADDADCCSNLDCKTECCIDGVCTAK